MSEPSQIDALIDQFQQLQDLSRREVENLREAKQQELIVSLRDIPNAVYIGQARNTIARWAADPDGDLDRFLRNRGAGVAPSYLVQTLDFVLAFIYEREKAGK